MSSFGPKASPAGRTKGMRINYTDEEDRPGQFALWSANCRRSLQGKAGQRELREFEAALLALPDKRLIRGKLMDEDGGVCAIGCYARHKGLDLSTVDLEDESDEVGIAAGMPRLVAWQIVALNDITLNTVWEKAEGPIQRGYGSYHGGIALVRDMTPEERYEKVLSWVRQQLGKSEGPSHARRTGLAR